MARIRTIKPEFWSSPGIETLEYRWRLLYIAMWQLADDWGRGAFIPRELLGFAFPMDEEMTSAEISAGCREISGVFGTVFYTVGKRHYFSIPSWEAPTNRQAREGFKISRPRRRGTVFFRRRRRSWRFSRKTGCAICATRGRCTENSGGFPEVPGRFRKIPPRNRGTGEQLYGG